MQGLHVSLHAVYWRRSPLPVWFLQLCQWRYSTTQTNKQKACHPVHVLYWYIVPPFELKMATKTFNYGYIVHSSIFICNFLSYPSAGLLFPTSRPHGPEGGLLREAWAVPGVLRVCRHPGLLQGTGRLLKNCWLLFNTQQCIADEVDQYGRAPQFSVIHQELIISKLNAGQEVLSSVLLETDANQLHVPMEAVENNIRGLE